MWWVYALGGALFLAVYSLIEKKILLKEHAAQFSAISALITFVFTLVFVPLIKLNFSFSLWLLMIAGGVLGASGFLFFAKAVRHMEISVASALRGMVPVFVLLFSVMILGESISGINGIGMVMIVIGVYVLESKKHHLFNPFRDISHSKPLLYLFVALLAWGLSANISRLILRGGDVNIYTLLFFKQLFVTIVLIAINVFAYQGFKDIKIAWGDSKDWLIILGAVGIVNGLLYYQAMSMAHAPLVSSIERLSVLGVILLGREYFHEKNILRKLVSAVIMICGALLVVI